LGEKVIELLKKRPTPPQSLQRLWWRQRRSTPELPANVPASLCSAAEGILALHPWLWKIERLFFELNGELRLHQLYLNNPNGVNMQAYAAAMIYAVFRVAPGRVAVAVAIASKKISPMTYIP
jgi:hypothetical protein